MYFILLANYPPFDKKYRGLQCIFSSLSMREMYPVSVILSGLSLYYVDRVAVA